MKFALRAVVGIITGLAAAFTLLVAVEIWSSVVHRIPPDFRGTIPDQVRHSPGWVLTVVVPVWGATAAVATWVAAHLGNRIGAGMVIALLTCAIAFNLTRLPYVVWFKIAMFAFFPIACYLGFRHGTRLEPTAEPCRPFT